MGRSRVVGEASTGAEARFLSGLYAALKRRSSTVMRGLVVATADSGFLAAVGMTIYFRTTRVRLIDRSFSLGEELVVRGIPRLAKDARRGAPRASHFGPREVRT